MINSIVIYAILNVIAKCLTTFPKIDKHLSTGIQLQQLGQIISTCVPDNHIDIHDTQGKSVVPKQTPPYPRDKFNLAHQSDKD